jgi:hypothetical protein
MSKSLEEVDAFIKSSAQYELFTCGPPGTGGPVGPHQRVRWKHSTQPWRTVSLRPTAKVG